jgi:CubicO group peptidase (beta-lactamase class C family)
VLRRVRAEYNVPALAAAFVRDGEIVDAAVGLRRIDRSDSVTIDDLFHVGSVSKPISATAIATLVEAGVLEWTTTVAGSFPDLVGRINPEYESVTVEQLLSHRGGVVPWEEDEEIVLAPVSAGTPREQRLAVLPWLLTRTPVAKPGTEHVYSNAGYMVAAAMAEKAAGTAWEALVEDRLAKPLDLGSLGFGWPAKTDSTQPWGHESSSHAFVPHDPSGAYQLGPWLAAAGDLHMTMRDLGRFAQLHLEGRQGKAVVLQPDTFRKLHTPNGDYALGWNVRETADHHLGSAGTFLAAIWVSVPRNVAIVLATNADADVALVSAVINGTLQAFAVPKP